MVYRNEAARRGLQFDIDVSKCPRLVVGDAKKIRTVIANLTANAREYSLPLPKESVVTNTSPVKYTRRGRISVECRAFEDPASLGDPDSIAVEIVVSDTGCGMTPEKLESIFREFEQVEASPAPLPTPPPPSVKGLGESSHVLSRRSTDDAGQA